MVAGLTERLDAPQKHVRRYVLFAADRVFRVVLEALAHIDEWETWPPFSHGYHIELSETFGATVGVRFDAANTIWDRLRRAPDLATKLQFALWTAYYDGGGTPTEQVWTPLSALVGMLGYSRRPRGDYRDQDQRLVGETVEAVFSLEIGATWRRARESASLRGRMWQEGLVGKARHGDQRERTWLSYRPGEWFSDAAWQRTNRFKGRVDRALLELDASRDRWPIRVGSAYAWLAKTNLRSGSILTLRLRSLVDQTGAGVVYAGHPARLRSIVEAAHDRLRAVGLIRAWEWLPGPGSDWLAGAIRVEWTGSGTSQCARTFPPLACQDLPSRVPLHPLSRAKTKVEIHPNRSKRSKGRPLTLRSGAASSCSTGHGSAREVVA